MPVYSGIPLNYTTDNVGPETFCHEKINEKCECCNTNKDGTQHRTTAICDTELTNYVYGTGTYRADRYMLSCEAE
jgi:hypothetical protein